MRVVVGFNRPARLRGDLLHHALHGVNPLGDTSIQSSLLREIANVTDFFLKKTTFESGSMSHSSSILTHKLTLRTNDPHDELFYR